ncbi:hypothetical protein EV126DRAFT_428800 [Verticillium dahliae]|nr:hypothetical protein EV126DRAFT_428800 [Verticillium dahliae]
MRFGRRWFVGFFILFLRLEDLCEKEGTADRLHQPTPLKCEHRDNQNLPFPCVVMMTARSLIFFFWGETFFDEMVSEIQKFSNVFVCLFMTGFSRGRSELDGTVPGQEQHNTEDLHTTGGCK